ncbi:MAG: excinuclease ABC subunit UvrA [Candidatus Krumholzibacteria bacterium]|nr:excinuclease ABC subunit UvrA [Candidatus Krumholzibacteria bacterium]
MAYDRIVIKGARQHNLQNLDIELPHRKVIAVTGVSGSGKSSLAFDTIYAEGQRRYIESLSTYARQFIEKLDRPELDSMSGISPTIAIRQKNTVSSARSTVGTATEIYDYLRLLYARVGKTCCPDCGIPVKAWSPSEVAGEVISRFAGKRIFVLMSEVMSGDGEWESRRKYLVSRGFVRILAGGEPTRIDEFDPGESGLDRLDIILDRLEASAENRTRIAEAVEQAYGEHEGTVDISTADLDERVRYSTVPSCSDCGRLFEAPTPLLFSFNSPYGACPVCKGFGDRMEFSEDLIIPDSRKSLSERAIDPWSRERFEFFHSKMLKFCRKMKIPTRVPWRDLDGEHRRKILEGSGDFSGVIPFLEKMKEKSYKKGHRFFTRRYMGFSRCRTCGGSRLREESHHVTFAGLRIGEIASRIPSEILKILEQADLEVSEKTISRDILSELVSRLSFMIDVGLGYLTLDRLTRTLSGGEAQRINLANSLGASLVDTLYVLDEPSIGLHAADNERLTSVMKKLRDMGNTVIVVEHDPDIILASDHILDLGPGPGSDGGRVLFNGPMEKARSVPPGDSRTLKALFNEPENKEIKKTQRKPSGSITLNGVSLHNIRDMDVKIPLGNLVCVTGVSGSGKSTLLIDVLFPILTGEKKRVRHNHVCEVFLEGQAGKTLLVDQSPIGSSPRSNPITYIKGFSFIRELFASQRKSMIRGYKTGRFSFNKTGGRCARCEGMGFRRVEMHFMADVFVPCEECGGRRFNRETLEVEYRGKNISQVLDMTVDEAIMFFDEIPALGEKLWILSKAGLGYLKLGQPSNTLSGGEAQRIKITRELAGARGDNNIYIMDEPTTGLHMSDITRLLRVFDELLDAGHSVLVIEHNMEVIANADHIIDLGPGGGDQGGRVVACGRPDKIKESRESRTGEYLKAYFKKFKQEE